LNTAIITNCTSRKSKAIKRVVLSRSVNVSSVQQLASHWVEVIDSNKGSTGAVDLYQGRGFSDARATAVAMDGDFYVVSAGLGLISAEDDVPSYDLTISDGPGSIASVLKQLSATPSDWWTALTKARNQQSPIIGLLTNRKYSQVWLAMPSTYLGMLSNEIECVDEKLLLEKVRIFTTSRGNKILPEKVRSCVMPYDQRLESTTYAGTLNDFPQRCMRHFAMELKCAGTNLEEAYSKVTDSLRGCAIPCQPLRRKLDDAEIVGLIKEAWIGCGGNSNRLLRYLRDDALVACEQGRFRRLWHQVKDELIGAYI
jgi:hypothetical protein